jgi:hypothetical protein
VVRWIKDISAAAGRRLKMLDNAEKTRAKIAARGKRAVIKPVKG